MLTRSDHPRGMGVPKVMEPQPRKACSDNGWKPYSSPSVRAPQIGSPLAGEYQIVKATVSFS